MGKKYIHFIGISGSGMSAAAKMSLERGNIVSGSDLDFYPVLEKLKALGATVTVGKHRAENIPPETELIVASNAVFDLDPNNPELREAKRRKLEILHYPEYVGRLTRGKKVLAISGTHGKTSTTSMLAYVFKNLGLDPSFVIGGEVPSLGGNSGIGNSDFFIVEACEYEGAFFNYEPETVVVTNIDRDHLDYFKNFDNIITAFKKFIQTIPAHGCLVIYGDDPGTQQLLKQLEEQKPVFPVITYGLAKTNDFFAEDISYASGVPRFTVNKKGTPEGKISVLLQVHGEHNLLNSLAVLAVSDFYRLSLANVAKTLATFQGTKRRMELIGIKNGIKIYDDYGHHPREIRTTLKAMRQKEVLPPVKGEAAFSSVQDQRLICVYQPHLYSRTMLLLDEIKHSFDDADLVLVTKICGAREKDPGTITSQMVVEHINHHYGFEKAILLPEFEDVVQWLDKNARPGDIVMTTSCGDVWKAAKMYKES